jgi:hypothetical protein
VERASRERAREPSTSERELTEPVDLALADGRTLNPEARGWSRLPLHRANLHGGFGRTKRWDYWAILAGDLVLSAVYADVDYLGLADVWWADLAAGRTGGRGLMTPGARGMQLPERPGSAPLRVVRRRFELEIADDASGATHLHARWRERDGRAARLDATVELPTGHESLNVVIPWSARRFQFTSKHQARPARGELVVGDDRWRFGDAHDGGEAFGVLDVGRGRWPYRTRWNWGGGAGRARGGGPVVGLQLGGRWTEGTGFTENGVLVDGRLTKLGRELRWSYAWDEPLCPWRVEDPGGRLRLELTPRHDKHSRIELGLLGAETHQVFGTWSGIFHPDEGPPLELEGLQGFAEEARWRW